MKIKSKIYAQLLLESLPGVISTHPEPAVGRMSDSPPAGGGVRGGGSGGEKSHHNGTTLSSIAERFWNLLQKNKQYKDLPGILTELEQLYAEKSGAAIAYVESGKELSEKELEEIEKRLSSYCHPELTCHPELVSGSVPASGSPKMPKQVRHDNIILKVKINPSITGLTAKIDEKVIDLSVEDKVLRLRKKLSS